MSVCPYTNLSTGWQGGGTQEYVGKSDDTGRRVMSKPRPEKVAAVEEVRNMFESSVSAVLTEYRGLTVADMESLRRSLAATGASYKVYKNTLVKRAISGTAHESLGSILEGPNAIAFSTGDLSDMARVLKTFSTSKEHLVIKGGVYEGSVVTREQLISIAELPSREVLLGRLAGMIRAPLQQMADLLAALPTNLAYGLKALLDTKEQVAPPDHHLDLQPHPESAQEQPSSSVQEQAVLHEHEHDEELPDQSSAIGKEA
ncbi:MAG: 50S ribosomal protein L10 [Actinobacteria bacterium]|nr:50S ribosomal protein L10 [Actinomycetota bacterium]MCL5446304.1 50S ribosomal protein L10 [Actinomycetota bacterium]